MMIKRLGFALGVAAAFLAIAAGLRFAAVEGMIAEDLAQRIVQVLVGLGLAAYANVMPKQISGPRRSVEAETRSQAALRVTGWSMTLAGLAYAGFWAFAPLPVADTVSLVPVVVAMVLTLGYAVWSFTACRRDAPAGN